MEENYLSILEFKEAQEGLTKAFVNEARKLLAKGIPITYQSGTDIIKEYPDGKKEIIGSAPSKIKIDKKIIILR